VVDVRDDAEVADDRGIGQTRSGGGGGGGGHGAPIVSNTDHFKNSPPYEEPGAVVFTPDGATLYSVARTQGVLAWDVRSATLAEQFELPER
jgi:hypothetical protein